MKNFNQMSLFDKSSTIALYLTLAILLLVGVVALVLKRSKPEMLKSSKSVALGFLLGYAIGLLSILFYLKLDEHISAGYIDLATFLPITILLGTSILLAIGALLISIFKKSAFSLYSKISLGIVGLFALVLFILNMISTYSEGAMDSKSEALLYVFTLALVGIIVSLPLIFGKKTLQADHTKSIVYASICIATSFALSYIRILELPSGGSVTFASLVPLMVYSYMFGSRKGVLAGAIYGLLQFIQAPWLVHPVQFLLDYPIAFAAIGLTAILKDTGVLKNKTVLQFAFGATFAVIIRYFSHVVSGIFIWGSADANYNAVAWSFLYNSFTLADLAIALVGGCLLFSSRAFVRQLGAIEQVKTNTPQNTNETSETENSANKNISVD